TLCGPPGKHVTQRASGQGCSPCHGDPPGQSEPAEQPVDELFLTLQNLLPCRWHGEPGGSVNLGKAVNLSRLRGPFELDSIAAQREGIPVSLNGPGVNTFAAPLLERTEVNEVPLGLEARLLEKFAPCYAEQVA